MNKILFICMVSIFVVSCSDSSEKTPVKPESNKIVAAYVTANSNRLPSPKYVTHINYAFGKVDMNTFDKVNIANIKALENMVALKSENPNLKVILSIGGWTAGGFSEMASNATCRTSFINDCANKCEKYNLDGIDIDWEFPGSSSAGIVSSPNDKQNLTLLMKGLREALGDSKVLTYASDAGAKYANFKEVTQYLDFVNVMVYDLGRPPYHNAALYPSSMSNFSVEQAVNAHKNAGVPVNKIVLGIPFYGHGSTALGVSDYVLFRELYKYDKYEHRRDQVAKVPYIVNGDGQMLVTYDDEESIELKCKYALNKGLRGVMYWEYSYDDSNETLTYLTYTTIMGS